MHMTKSEQFAKLLLAWFYSNQRSFPWRQTSDPYQILLAEIFLRKTDAKKVLGVYERFLNQYQGIEEIAHANESDLANFLKPLGLYRHRAKELLNLAKTVLIAHNGEIPRSKQELLGLPGVGNYIANAVLCFAFGESVPLLDANIIRILIRVFSLKSNKKRPRDDPKLWQAVRQMIPKTQARDFNLALLDLAATVCCPKKPKCEICPVSSMCDYYRASELLV
jgi:A/G-specific adenine glycosylase